jgi:hypothetical protein
MENKKRLIGFFTSLFLLSLLVLPTSSAQAAMEMGEGATMDDGMKMDDSMMVMEDGTMMMGHSMGPTIGGRMLHAWVSLMAAIVIFFIALRYMAGGKLAQPIMLIGIGALVDGLMGLISSPADHMMTMWIGALVFSSSVVLAIIWIGKIFGVFSMKTKA